MFLLVEKSAPVLITSKVTATQLWYADPCPGPITDVPQGSGLGDCTQINICNVYRFSSFSDRGGDISFENYPKLQRLHSIARARAVVQNILGLFIASPEVR
ncbi:hypothetical protein OO255_27760, partial [Pseudomonas sp. DCB_BZ]|nr:hypothetical protein [Pseudomonas sp. DCB_BZ]